jgi:hypothetical protein
MSDIDPADVPVPELPANTQVTDGAIPDPPVVDSVSAPSDTEVHAAVEQAYAQTDQADQAAVEHVVAPTHAPTASVLTEHSSYTVFTRPDGSAYFEQKLGGS